ncbi:UDP-N-acetylmuramate dehydrogenase [candidate division KSB1 bacterium]|nr:UDP-N-acetylmuramate dehydrogenase [candidate division KSB1 bacterium]
MSEYTKIRIGGPADYLFIAATHKDLVDILAYCAAHKIRYLVLGEGTNVFFADTGFRGLIVINRCTSITQTDATTIRAEAGVSMDNLLATCLNASLTGFEFAAGIPGTVGGAIYGNAGAYGKTISELMTQAKILHPEGGIQWMPPEYFQFAYRDSFLKRYPATILAAEFRLESGDPKAIRSRMDEILAMRHAKLPPDDWATAGSYFKNIKTDPDNPLPAAKLLDEIGSKQTSVGDAAIYHKHANIFYNKGHATADDVLRLEEILRERVQQKFGILLEREVMYFE